MKKNILKPILITGLWLLISNITFAAVTPEELKNAVLQKTQALQEINQKISQAQKGLEETANKGRTLQKEIKKADQQIGQLNLSIKASEINIEKLGLELNSLQYEISDVRSQMAVKKSGVAQLLRIIQQKDNENLLAILLKNRSLSDSVSELENITKFNDSLAAEIDGLQALNSQLTEKLDLTSQKKAGKELENQNLKNRKVLAANSKTEKQTLLTQTKNQEKTFQTLISELEKQQNAISDEIDKMEDELRSKFDSSLLPSKRPGVLAWPVKLAKDGGTAYITQHFGVVSYLYRGKPHNGLDIGGMPIGTPVFAADDGKVVAVDNNDRLIWNKYQYGKYILIDHNNNLSTLYGHLSAQTVRIGDSVKKGDLIGYIGKTGYATGPHLHLGLYWTPSIFMKSIPPAAGLVPIGVTISPEDYL